VEPYKEEEGRLLRIMCMACAWSFLRGGQFLT
jgi:hypothetical protein